MSGSSLLRTTRLDPRNDPDGPVSGLTVSDERGWQALRYFSLYRIVISGLFAVLALVEKLPSNFSNFNLQHFTLIACAYLGLAIAAQIGVERRWAPIRFLVYAHVMTDIVFVTIFIRASGGIEGGFGMLMIVAIAGACLFVQPKVAVFFAALASLAAFAETILGILYLDYPSADYAQAGLLGAGLFATAFLASILADQARRSEALAAAQAVDIENLSRLNDYIVQRMRSGIIVLDDKHSSVLNNEAAASMLSGGAESSDILKIAMPESLTNAYQRWLVDDINSKTPIELDSHGSEVIVSFTPLGQGHTGGTLIFLEDAAEIRQRAQQLNLASLGRLTGSIAHEIRNPLGAIRAAGQLLNESPKLDEQDRRLTEIIEQHSQRMNNIIENVMTIGRRKLAIAESFSLRPWFESFLDELQERKKLQGSDLRCDWLENDLVVRMDTSQLNQVLWNLCENALRYSSTAPLLAFTCGRSSGSARPFIEVADTGPGMSDKVTEQIFEPFYTGETSGTGLGLYIARELCESNQASLVLTAHGHGGCRFRINFAHPDRQQLTE
ncbi:MAG: two-component system sensor histidine kinase PilS (NtrC family) [Gammaproteobacteria bacterium]|jgi:two-component system sensor histidine kinase PilS (NtrC family)